MKFKRSPIEEKSYLVVDDFGDMRMLIRNMLITLGVKDIVLTSNGIETINAMRHQRFDVVLCDYNLGKGKDGQQVLEEARERDLIGLGTLFIMVTAENARNMVMGAVDYQPDSYLTKPFNKDLLRLRLEKLLKRKENLIEIERSVRSKNYIKALELIDQRLANKPANAMELMKLKADVALMNQDVDLAATVYSKILTVREIPWARLGLGKTLFLSTRYEEARELFLGLIDENESYTIAYDWLAKTYKAIQQLENAQEILEKATRLSPKVVARQRVLGELALINKDTTVAEKAFSNAVRFGKHSVYKHPSLYSNLAKINAEKGDTQTAKRLLKDIDREFGGDSEAGFYADAAACVIETKLGNREAAEAAINRANRHYENIGHSAVRECALEMARTFHAIGQPEQALTLLQETVRNNHSDEALLNEIGTTMESLGLQDNSAEFINNIRKEIIRINNRGVALAQKGDLEEAIALFEKAAEKMPGNKVVNLNAARVLMMSIDRQGMSAVDTGKVQLYLDRVKHVDPDNPTLRKLSEQFRQTVDQA